jgi:hypothetical protein
MKKYGEDASMSSSIWGLAIMAALITLAIVSQFSDTATCYKMPGCMTMRSILGPGFSGLNN